jgi:hypothetical protein
VRAVDDEVTNDNAGLKAITVLKLPLRSAIFRTSIAPRSISMNHRLQTRYGARSDRSGDARHPPQCKTYVSSTS